MVAVSDFKILNWHLLDQNVCRWLLITAAPHFATALWQQHARTSPIASHQNVRGKCGQIHLTCVRDDWRALVHRIIKFFWPTVSRISWQAEQLHYQMGLRSSDTKRNLSPVQQAEGTVVTSRRGVRPIWQVFVVSLSPSRRMAGHCLKLGLYHFLPRPTICHYIDIIQLLKTSWSPVKGMLPNV